MNALTPLLDAAAGKPRENFDTAVFCGCDGGNTLVAQIPGIVECSRIAKIARWNKRARELDALAIAQEWHARGIERILRIDGQPDSGTSIAGLRASLDSFRFDVDPLAERARGFLLQLAFGDHVRCDYYLFAITKVRRRGRGSPAHLNCERTACEYRAECNYRSSKRAAVQQIDRTAYKNDRGNYPPARRS